MEKKYNKADYYFGSKPVLERAEDENEFEGSLTTSPELTDLAFIHELPSAFWRSIWLGFVNKGKIEVVRPDAEDGEIGFIPTYQFEASRPKQIWDSPIWRMSGELAKFQGGWPGWEDVEFFSVFEVIGFEDLKSVSLFFKVYFWCGCTGQIVQRSKNQRLLIGIFRPSSPSLPHTPMPIRCTSASDSARCSTIRPISCTSALGRIYGPRRATIDVTRLLDPTLLTVPSRWSVSRSITIASFGSPRRNACFM